VEAIATAELLGEVFDNSKFGFPHGVQSEVAEVVAKAVVSG
jgi:hypothetical protein